MIDDDIRDRLAVERTRLANERTVLAYVRTALALAAAGAALLQFFPSLDWLFWMAWGLVGAGASLLAVGAYRFQSVRGRLRE